MYCPNCGNKKRKNDAYCFQCGTAFNDINPSTNTTIPKLKDISKLSIILIATITLIIFPAILFGGKKTINLDSYLSVSFDGWDGFGKADAEINYEAFIDDYATKIEYTDDYYMTSAHAVDAFVKYMRVDIEQSDGTLSNGDEVYVTWDIDENDLSEIKKYFNYNVKFSDSLKFKVNGLSTPREFDPFENISIACEGMNGMGIARVQGEDNRFNYRIEPKENLSNGQTVIVQLSDSSQYYTANYGLIPIVSEKEYVVENLSVPLDDFDQILNRDLQSIIEDGKSYINDKYFFVDTNGNQEFFCEELDYCGTIFFPPKNYDDNYAITLFKIVGKLTKPGYETNRYQFYHPVLFKTLIQNADGSVNYKRSAYAPKMEHLGAAKIRSLDEESRVEIQYLDGFKTLEDAISYYSDNTSVWHSN